MKNLIIILLITVFCSTITLSQFNFNIGFNKTMIMTSISAQGQMVDYSIFSFQTDLFPLNIIREDTYNDTPSKVSMYSTYRAIPVIGLGFVSMSLSDSSFAQKIIYNFMLPYIIIGALTTSQVHLNYYGFDSLKYTPIRSSLFIGTQTDYFEGKKVNWWKFGFNYGIEIQFVLNRTNRKKKIYPPNTIGLQFGISNHWDYVKSFIKKPNEYFIRSKYFF